MDKENYYRDYLALDNILNAQVPIVKNAHDEHFFIVIHQVYELWFKQILYEFTAIRERLSKELDGFVIAKLQRVKRILALLVEQIDVLETLGPMDFLDFRDDLVPASGFQSLQFRKIEYFLGFFEGQKTCPFSNSRLDEKDVQSLRCLANERSLAAVLNDYLAGLNCGSKAFWEDYQAKVLRHLNKEQDLVAHNSSLSQHTRQIELAMIEKNKQNIQEFFSGTYQAKPFSHAALLSALYIRLYPEKSEWIQASMMLELFLDIDEELSMWRYRHYMMVQRILGQKIGTGGSSGQDYLKKGIESHRYFMPLFDLSNYLIARKNLTV